MRRFALTLSAVAGLLTLSACANDPYYGDSSYGGSYYGDSYGNSYSGGAYYGNDGYRDRYRDRDRNYYGRRGYRY